ncbi:MAG TPA: alpha-amylase/4-alpha-glucanotransferase domain-containing protein, partial [Bacteroidota bacterium]
EHENSWVKTMHVATVLDLFSPVGRIYLPSASYSEMMKWALSAPGFISLERFEQELKERKLFDENSMFVRGGFWRNFLAKYPEANHMHKKMLRVAARVHGAGSNGAVPAEVRDALWAGQCNDPYWHGVFGGLYLPNLRFPVYHNLLKAEGGVDALQGQREPTVEEVDFDADGNHEVVAETRRFDFCFTPAFGGSLVELSVKPEAVNFLDIMSRREEGYHRRLIEAAHGRVVPGAQVVEVKESGLEQHLFFDWYRHGSLLDHFFGEGTTLNAVLQCRYPELGDFVNQPYVASISVRGKAVEIALERQGALWRPAGPHRLTVRKVVRYAEGDDAFSVDYTLTNRESLPVDLWFGIEWCVGAMAGDAPDRFYDIEGRKLMDCRLRSMGEEPAVRSVKLVDRWLHLQTVFTFDTPAVLWRFPLETVSLSEGGFERIYQGSVVLPHWRIHLDPADAQSNRHQFRLRATQAVTQA